MAEKLLSVGLDVGTTSTQMVLSELIVENQASAFSVPQLEIAERNVRYKSPVFFTPLLQGDLVDGEKIRQIVQTQYQAAGITREAVDTGAIIITGETSRKENAATVLDNISDFAGNFVVATAGPDLESVLAAKGAGAVEFSAETGKTVLHMDIGGGTSNLALIESGKITATGCLNVGGRLVKFDQTGRISYISPVLSGLFKEKVGEIPSPVQLQALAEDLTSALEMAASLCPRTDLFHQLWTQEATKNWPNIPKGVTLSFSGGVADCIETTYETNAFGDLGPILGQALKRSRLCAGEYRLGSETIRATVIGAGCHSAQLSGSTIFYQNVDFPMKNLPVVTELSTLAALDSPGVLALPGIQAGHYGDILALADKIAENRPEGPVRIALEADMAKALGHALALRLGKAASILCIDRLQLPAHSYLDIAAPVGSALPVVVKTLILNR